MSKAMGWVGRPHVVVLLVGGVVGLVMVLVVPALAGIDEPYHYLRAWSISDGDLVPDKGDLPGGVRGGGTCVPATITRQLFDIRRPYLEHLIPNYDGSDPLKATKACPENVGERVVFVDMATFAWYTPMSYAPQVFAVAIGRLTGAGVSTQLVLARLASLAAYLALCAWAVALAPRAKWALVAIALLPVSMFQAATSLSPDGLTLAAVLLLIATALRACDAELALPRARVLFEAALSCGLLAIAKPTYIVMVVVYVAVVVTRRVLWPVLVVAGGAMAASVSWHAVFRPLFVCDVRYFGVATNPDRQTSNLVRAPWRLLTAAARSVADHGGQWVRDTVVIGDRVVPWGLGLCAIALVGFVALSLAPTSGSPLTGLQRVIFIGAGGIGVLAVLAGWLISCSRAELRILNPPHARLLVPCLAPILVGLSPPWSRSPSPSRWRVPGWAIAAIIAAFYVVWISAMSATMR